MAAALPPPKLHQIYLLLREQLEERRYADAVSGEPQLTKAFGVERVTVRLTVEVAALEG